MTNPAARESLPLRWTEARRALSWFAPRITGRITAYEAFGTACGVAVVVVMFAIALVTFANGDSRGALPYAGLGALFLAIAPISAMQVLTHRARRRRLLHRGAARDGVIVDAWLIPTDASYGGVRFRYDTGLGGTHEAIAFDGAGVIERFRPGDPVRVWFDPDRPEDAVLDVD